MIAVDLTTAEAFRSHMQAGVCLEWFPKWLRCLSAVRLLVAAHRKNVNPELCWPAVEKAAVDLWQMEHSAAALDCEPPVTKDAARRPLWEALTALGKSPGDEACRVRVLNTALAFNWQSLPDAVYAVGMLRLCGAAAGLTEG